MGNDTFRLLNWREKIIDQKLIDKINELAKKQKTIGLNEEEKKLQHELRQEYLRLFREGFKQQLDAIEIVDSNKH